MLSIIDGVKVQKNNISRKQVAGNIFRNWIYYKLYTMKKAHPIYQEQMEVLLKLCMKGSELHITTNNATLRVADK